MSESGAFPADGPVGRSTVRALAPLIAGFVLLVAIVLGTGWLILAEDRNDEALRGLLEARAELSDLLSDVQDAETGQRGFLLTGDEAYLAPYEAATANLGPRMDRVDRLVGDDPLQAADMRSLRHAGEEKLDELRTSVELRRADRAEESLARMRSGAGKALMDRVRTVYADLAARNRALILTSQQRASAAANAVALAVALATLLLVALAGFAVSDAYRRNTRLARAYEDVRGKNDALLVANANRDRLEAQLRQSQKMEAMGQLTGGLAHDFNNMLAIVIGNLTVMKRRLERGETRIERYVDQAAEGASRAATLTHRLLAFARNQPLAPETVEPNRLVAGMSDLLRRTLGETVQIETVLAAGLWRTRADPNQLESALLNLAINARDAMPGGGRLTVETANAHVDEGYAADHLGVRPGQYVMIAVSDTGTGMSQEVAAKAFEPFFTTKQPGRGTGLGLSQVFGFARQSDGHVKIYSEPGSGTTVKIYLPRLTGAQAAETQRTGAAPTIPEGSAQEVILVVEDEAGVRRLTVEALRELRYTVIHADGGASALRLLDTHPDIALLFTDVMMPEMNGRQLADAARTRRPGLKVLYTTGYTSNAIVHNGVIDADVEMIGKPFTLEQLARKVRQAIAA